MILDFTNFMDLIDITNLKYLMFSWCARAESNCQSPASEADALSIGPRAHGYKNITL